MQREAVQQRGGAAPEGGTAAAAHADGVISSASSAGSASSGSACDSLRGSSIRFDADDGAKSADADYRIIEFAKATGRAGITTQ